LSAISPQELEKLLSIDEEIRRCELCPLWKSRTKAVPGSGLKQKGVLMFVGEGPGRNEDLTGEPFVGRGGKLLDGFLDGAGIKRSQVFVTNVVKCRPPENRKPFPEEVRTCTSNFLERQIEILEPKLICTLGATAMEYFTGEKKIGSFRGKVTKAKNGYSIYPLYHPASALRNKTHKATLEKDVMKIPKVLKRLKRSPKLSA